MKISTGIPHIRPVSIVVYVCVVLVRPVSIVVYVCVVLVVQRLRQYFAYIVIRTEKVANAKRHTLCMCRTCSCRGWDMEVHSRD